MKYLKTFESTIRDVLPQKNDYVVLLDMYKPPRENDVLGKITKITKEEQTENSDKSNIGDIIEYYQVIELNNPEKRDIYHFVELDEIDFFSPNIEDAKMFILNNKYNI